MTFPVYLNLAGFRIHLHPVFELLAYSVGFQSYLFLRHKHPHPKMPLDKMAPVLLACVIGAALGAKILAILESPIAHWNARDNLMAMLAGKTIVGGILGGWIGTEIGKRIVGVSMRTGDAIVFPLIIGLCIGRVGCFLTGLNDQTHGNATTLPWGVDFGDGIFRHPTQLYEIAVLLLTGSLLLIFRKPLSHRDGDRFRVLMLAYFGYRLLVEFIKPAERIYLGLSAIQWASLLGVVLALVQLLQTERTEEASTSSATP